MFKSFGQAFADLLSPVVLRFIVLVGFGSTLFWIIILWLFWEPYSRIVGSWLSHIPFVGGWEWLQNTGAFLAALLGAYMLIILTVSTLTSLLSEKVLLKLAKRHYPHLRARGAGKIHKSLYYTIRAGIVFVILFLILLPLLFVPVVGQIVMLLLWAILLKNPTLYDVGTLFLNDEKKIMKQSRSVWLVAIIAALFNYIPVLNLFAPLFAQILFMHWLLARSSLS